MASITAARMKKELRILMTDPPSGISCWQTDDSLTTLEAQIIGTPGSVYSGGVYKLHIKIPTRYPFEPPRILFKTKIYHPNIDPDGRICLDLLKLPPTGSWKPSINISTLLSSIQLLMNDPNPDDPLMTDIADEFRHNREVYLRKAKEWCKTYALQTVKSEQQNWEDNGISSESDMESEEDCEDTQVSHASLQGKRPLEESNVSGKQKRRALESIN